MGRIALALSFMTFVGSYVTQSEKLPMSDDFRAKAGVVSEALSEANDSPAVKAALDMLAARRAATQPFPVAPVPT